MLVQQERQDWEAEIPSEAANPINQLILNNRVAAFRLAKHSLRRWRITIPIDEIQSAADLALCEAAQNFDPSRKTAFTTFLYYHLKGTLLSYLSSNKLPRIANIERASLAQGSSESEALDGVIMTESGQSPEQETYLKEIRGECNEALSNLSALERLIVIRVNVLEDKVANVARQIGYSRGHVSSLNSNATRRVRAALEHLKAA